MRLEIGSDSTWLTNWDTSSSMPTLRWTWKRRPIGLPVPFWYRPRLSTWNSAERDPILVWMSCFCSRTNTVSAFKLGFGERSIWRSSTETRITRCFDASVSGGGELKNLEAYPSKDRADCACWSTKHMHNV